MVQGSTLRATFGVAPAPARWLLIKEDMTECNRAAVAWVAGASFAMMPMTADLKEGMTWARRGLHPGTDSKSADRQKATISYNQLQFATIRYVFWGVSACTLWRRSQCAP